MAIVKNGPLRVVVVGAGAGGLEALQLLFAAMPVDAGLAFVICRRLQPGLSDPLADLLRMQTAMPVIRAESGMALQADRIHLVAPDAGMILLKDRLVPLSVDRDGDDDRAEPAVSPIDLLLHSLAASKGPGAIAMIVSGNDRDGLRGCASIRELGGLVLVQHPESAEHAAMPRRVIDADLASAVAPPGAMPDLIRRHLSGKQISAGRRKDEGMDNEAIVRIVSLLEAELAVDAHAYRPTLLAKSVRRRLSLSKATTLADYADLLADDETERSALHDDLMIGVTAFFRDPEAFAALGSEVLPILVERMSPEQPIRVWVPACASGEEAYSLAMVILDQIERAGKHPNLEILASDRSTSALKRARLGCYRRDRLGDAPPDLVERYLQSDGKRTEVVPLLRRHVTFFDHDILQAPPPDDIDLVSCRNLLIYLTAASREKAVSACVEALKSDGFLFLGPSEQPEPSITGLTAIHGRLRIYQKTAPPAVDGALDRLSAAQKRKPGEIILPPDMDEQQQLNLPAHNAFASSSTDSVTTGNQGMLESTVDTLLASNDTLRRRNRDLRAENQRLASAHAALDDVATMVAHDLKAPLITIDHLMTRLKEEVSKGDSGQDASDWFKSIRHQLIGLNRIIDDLLTYARQGPADSADLQQVNIGDLLRETLTLVGLPKGVKVLMRPPSLEVTTWDIPLACILRNLLGQALERVGDASGSIRIEASTAKGVLTIDIADDGRHTDRWTESGLGLAIVRQLLDTANGKLTSRADSSGRGHEVRFTWPIEGSSMHETEGKSSRAT